METKIMSRIKKSLCGSGSTSVLSGERNREVDQEWRFHS